jgi:hypothetical protein
MRFRELNINEDSDLGGIFGRTISTMKRALGEVDPRPDEKTDPEGAARWDREYGGSYDPETGQEIQSGSGERAGAGSEPQTFDGDELASLSGGEGYAEGKSAAEQFLGSRISNSDWDMLIRATAAEAGQNQQERAAVMGVVLNRVRSSQYPNSIREVLYQRNQFQAVTGTSANGNQPSRWFTNVQPQTVAQVVAAAREHLGNVDRSWLNFTSNITAAYGAGTNIGFRTAMRNADGAQVIGGTVFGTV